MWIYTKDGFYSIVQDRNDPGYLIVRARVKGDLEALLLGLPIKKTPDNDYRYRMRAPKAMIAMTLANWCIMQIDYPNFKDSISDKRRSPYYGKVWAAMADMQDDLTFDTNKD